MAKPRTRCVIWEGARNNHGYGVKRVGRKLRLAHVLAWEAVNGPVPEGYELHHRCENPACWRVDHLEVVTHAENCRVGRRAKLTAEQVGEIREASGTQAAIAARFEISRGHVSRIRSGARWATA
jgi:hypothetical protein